jgi:hypothetical protein
MLMARSALVHFSVPSFDKLSNKLCVRLVKREELEDTSPIEAASIRSTMRWYPFCLCIVRWRVAKPVSWVQVHIKAKEQHGDFIVTF